MKKIAEMEDAATVGSNPFMMAGRSMDAMNTAAANPNGAMNGFIGMNMAGGMGGGMMNAAQQFYNMGMQQQQMQQAQQSTAPVADGWKCACGATATGKFCPECGAKKPADEPQYRCDKCGWEPEDPRNPPKFCPECGDRFGAEDQI
jgi:membrane protease subunit (stomatin/prohibitin family)